MQQELNKIIKQTFINHRGCHVEVRRNGYYWNRELHKNIIKLNEAIDKTYITISDSIKKGQQPKVTTLNP